MAAKWVYFSSIGDYFRHVLQITWSVLYQCFYSLLQVAELAGFWLLTLLQIPLTAYLLANIDTIILPLERAINIVLALFLLSQLLLGFRALQLMIRAQAVKFHLTQFNRLEDIPMQTLNSKKMV